MYGITFNGKHSFNDFGLYVEEKFINPPNKVKVKEPIPGMNGYLDFSTVASGGEIVYDTRIITVKLALISYTREKLYTLYSKILEWLVDTGKSQLIFDFMSDYYFMAEVEEAPNFEEFVDNGDLTVTFIADPFKTGVDYTGNNKWDTFNFEEDYLQDNEFDVTDTLTITMYNPGRPVVPVINVNAAMSLIFNSKTYNLVIGDNKFYDFKLANGANSITINGTGHIKILFRKTVL